MKGPLCTVAALTLLLCATASAGDLTLEGEPIQLWPGGGVTVPLHNKVNFVFLGEGFHTDDEMALCGQRALEGMANLLNADYLSDCSEDITIWYIRVRSTDSGVRHYRRSGKPAGIDPRTNLYIFNQQLVEKNTPFDICLEGTNPFVASMLTTYGDLFVDNSTYDVALSTIPGLQLSHTTIPIIIVNTQDTTGRACWVPYRGSQQHWRGPILLPAHDNDFYTLRHEVGHSLGGLLDEYGMSVAELFEGEFLRVLTGTLGAGDLLIPNYSISSRAVDPDRKWAGYQCVRGVKPVRLSDIKPGPLAHLAYVPSSQCVMNGGLRCCPICLRALRGKIDQVAGRPTVGDPPLPMSPRPQLNSAEIVLYLNGIPTVTYPITPGCQISLESHTDFTFTLSGVDPDDGYSNTEHQMCFFVTLTTEAKHGLDPFDPIDALKLDEAQFAQPTCAQTYWRQVQAGQPHTFNHVEWAERRCWYTVVDVYNVKIWAMNSAGLLSDPIEFTINVTPSN